MYASYTSMASRRSAQIDIILSIIQVRTLLLPEPPRRHSSVPWTLTYNTQNPTDFQYPRERLIPVSTLSTHKPGLLLLLLLWLLHVHRVLSWHAHVHAHASHIVSSLLRHHTHSGLLRHHTHASLLRHHCTVVTGRQRHETGGLWPKRVIFV